MKRVLFTILVFFCLCGQGWGATVYVKADATGAANGTSWADAYTLCSTAQTALNALGSNGHTMYVAPGTYTNDFLTLTDADAVNETVYGVSAAGIAAGCAGATCQNYPATKDEVVLNIATTQHAISFSQLGINIKNITLNTTAANKIMLNGTGGALTVTNIKTIDAGSYIISISGAATLVSNNSWYFGGSDLSGWEAAVYTGGTSSFTSNYDLWTDSPNKILGHAAIFYNNSAGAITVNNPTIFTKTDHSKVFNYTAGGTTTINNGIVIGGGDAAVFNRDYGIMAVNTSLVSGNPVNAIPEYDGTITVDAFSTNNVGRNPKFVNAGFPAFVVPVVDDASNSAYAQALATELAARGLKGTWFVESRRMDTPVLDALHTMIDSGVMSIGVHGSVHSSLITPNGAKLYDVTKAAETITISADRNTITLSGGGSVTGCLTKTLNAIKAALEVLGATVTPNATYVGNASGKVSAEEYGEVLATGTAVNTLNLLVDATGATGLYKAAIVDAKTEAETKIQAVHPTWTAKVYATPYGDSTTAAEAVMKSPAGFIAARPYASMSGASSTLGSINVYKSGVVSYVSLDSADPAVVRMRAERLCNWLSVVGGAVYVLSHSESQFSIANWKILLDVVSSYSNITVTSGDVLADTVRSSPWTDSGDGITFTRTLPMNTDFHLQSGSPAIDAGTDVGLTTDYSGAIVPKGSGFDIGAYEFDRTRHNAYMKRLQLQLR